MPQIWITSFTQKNTSIVDVLGSLSTRHDDNRIRRIDVHPWSSMSSGLLVYYLLNAFIVLTEQKWTRILLDPQNYLPYIKNCIYRPIFPQLCCFPYNVMVKYNFPLYMAFMEYEKAFDSIDHWILIKELNHARIDSRYTRLIRSIYQHARATIEMHECNNSLPIKRGIRQKDTFSPKWFTLALEAILKGLNG